MGAIVEQWGIFEKVLPGPAYGNPFRDVSLTASFTQHSRTIAVHGFYDGEGRFVIRFMPDTMGAWGFRTSSNRPELDGHEGSFEVGPPTGGNHGPVRVANEFGFAYADGTPHWSFGTTSYGWVNQPDERSAETIRTLETTRFNKMRMCVFPKNYEYVREDPPVFPFQCNEDGSFDHTRPNPEHFKRFDRAISELMKLGIEADIILFHPYDFGKWGFDSMALEDDDAYLRYVVARFAAYRNVWWSLANEFDIMHGKTDADWDRFLRIIAEEDPYPRLRSIHNCMRFFDHARPEVSHASIQTTRIDRIAEWRDSYHKPIVIDECGYEGNVEHSWGNLSPQELTLRFWSGVCRGGFVGHSETYLEPNDLMWWPKGGHLRGESAARIGFLREIVEPVGSSPLTPFPDYFKWDTLILCAGVEGRFYLAYFGIQRLGFRVFNLPPGEFQIAVIDTWNMTIDVQHPRASGEVRVELPGREYMAVRMTRIES